MAEVALMIPQGKQMAGAALLIPQWEQTQGQQVQRTLVEVNRLKLHRAQSWLRMLGLGLRSVDSLFTQQQ